MTSCAPSLADSSLGQIVVSENPKIANSPFAKN